MKEYRLVLILAMLAFPMVAPGQTYFSPGFHLGYRFGETGGFVSGIEVSVVQWGNRSKEQGRSQLSNQN